MSICFPSRRKELADVSFVAGLVGCIERDDLIGLTYLISSRVCHKIMLNVRIKRCFFINDKKVRSLNQIDIY